VDYRRCCHKANKQEDGAYESTTRKGILRTLLIEFMERKMLNKIGYCVIFGLSLSFFGKDILNMGPLDPREIDGDIDTAPIEDDGIQEKENGKCR
jgi:hypothetical protein